MRRDAPGALITQPNRDPRTAVAIIYETGSIYITNRPGIANVPGNVIHGALKDLSSSSQDLYPDQGRSTIGSLSFTAVDIDESLTDEIRTQLLTNDRGLNLKEVRVITGDTDDFVDWQDNRVDTYVVNAVSRQGRSYVFTCSDRTREQRVSIFEQQKTRLASSITATDATINVLDTTGFEMLAHTAAFSEAPGDTVGYFKIKQTGEIVRYTGTTATSFTGCTRARFNTVAQPITVDGGTEADRKPEIEEFIYLEMPGPELLYAIQTGVILSSSNTLPSRWHMGIDEAYVDADAYEAIGTDLYDPADLDGGLVLRFVNLQKEDGKKFAEEQLHVTMGTYPTVNTFGILGIKRLASIVSTSSPAVVLYAHNIIEHGDVRHALARVINRVVVNWNHDGDDFSRTDILRNENSIAVHGASRPLTLNLRGIHVSNHSRATLNRIFNYITERYGAPPIEADLTVSRALNNLEIGDTAQLVLERVPDFAGAAYLNRTVEIQGRQVNWKTGKVRVRVFASTSRTIQDAGGGTAAVLPDAYYTSEGTNLTSVLTIAGDAVTASGTITGGSDARVAVFYYNGNLTINAGVTVSITGNVQLRIKGTLTVNGSIDGAGNGLSGLSDPNSVSASMINSPDQVEGFIGASRGSAGIRLRTMILGLPLHADSAMPPLSRGVNPAFPALNVSVESDTLVGLPAELRGAPGGWGGTVYSLNNNGTTVVRALGGTGGDGGAGLLLICRGLAFGVSGEIDLSGANGAAGGTYVPGITLNAGAGGGGAPGALYVLLDGDTVTYPDLSSAFLASQGSTPQTGTPMDQLTMQTSTLPTGSTGMDPGTPVEDRWEPNHRVQYVPSNIALGESVDELVPAPTGLADTADGAGVLLQWTSPPADLHDYIEVWEATTNDRTGALLLSSRKASSLFVSKASSVTRYYWIRAVKEQGGVKGYSAWHPTGSTSGVSATFGGATGPSGSDGNSVFFASVFKRSASPPSTPSGGQYVFDTQTLTPPATWSVTPPASDGNPCYVSNAVAEINGVSGTDTTLAWTSPQLLVSDGANGADGADGSDGNSVFFASVFKRAASPPSTPTGGQYVFDTQTLTPPSGWSVSPPASDGNPCYVSNSVAEINGTSGTDTTLTWTSPQELVSDGADGADGEHAWTPILSNVTRSAGSTYTKTGGVDNTYDAAFRSLEGYSACAVSWRFSQTNLAVGVGLTTDPAVDDDYDTIDYWLHCTAAGGIEIYQNGTSQGSFGSASTTDQYSVTYDGMVVRFWKNATALLSRQLVGAQLYADSSFYDTGAAVDHVSFGQMTHVPVQSSGFAADSAGLPAGWRGIDGITDRSQLSLDNARLKIASSPDTNLAYGLSAIPINDTKVYQLTIRHVSSTSSADGLYIRFAELNTTLSAGKTHVGASSGAEEVVQAFTSLKAVSPSMENVAMPGTTPVTQTFTYTPTSGTRMATLWLQVADPDTAGVSYIVEWVALTELGSNVDLLPGVRAPGTTEDLIPEAVDEVVMVEEASYMNGASSGTLEEFVAYATITVESALDVVEIATTCRAQHYSISGAGSAYLVLAYRENPSGSFTEMALPLEKTTAVGTYERMSGVASVTGLTPDTYDFGLMNHSEETIGGEYGILSVENTVAVVRMKR